MSNIPPPKKEWPVNDSYLHPVVKLQFWSTGVYVVPGLLSSGVVEPGRLVGCLDLWHIKILRLFNAKLILYK